MYFVQYSLSFTFVNILNSSLTKVFHGTAVVSSTLEEIGTDVDFGNTSISVYNLYKKRDGHKGHELMLFDGSEVSDSCFGTPLFMSVAVMPYNIVELRNTFFMCASTVLIL